MGHKKNLVLSFVGEDSVHKNWIASPDEKEFDLALIYYGNEPGRYEEDADFYLDRKGFKFGLLKDLAPQELAELLPKYERIWLPDDDISGDTQTINRLFQTCEKHNLRVAQPAIRNGELSYESLRVDPRFELRYTPYVEVMCPVLRRDAFEQALPTFQESISSWGIDWIWSKRCGKREIAIIDSTPMDHVRPLGVGTLYQQLAEKGITPEEELWQLLDRYGIRNRRQIRLLDRGEYRMRGILTDGSLGWNQSFFKQLMKKMAA